jgi:hypothetical protein
VSRAALRPTQPPIQLVPGGVSFPGCKARPERDADHSPQLVPRSRMSSYFSSPSWRLHGGSGTAFFAFYYTIIVQCEAANSLPSVLPPSTISCFRFVMNSGSRRIARATFVSGPRHRSVICSGKVRASIRLCTYTLMLS